MATICHDTKNQLTTHAAKGRNNQTKGFIKMAKIEGAVIIDQERCKGCPADCIGCSSCAIVCPDGCIEVYRITSK